MNGGFLRLQSHREVAQLRIHLQLLSIKSFIRIAVPVEVTAFELQLGFLIRTNRMAVVALPVNHGGNSCTLQFDLAIDGGGRQVASGLMIKKAFWAETFDRLFRILSRLSASASGRWLKSFARKRRLWPQIDPKRLLMLRWSSRHRRAGVG
jgi:hypothetical protein